MLSIAPNGSTNKEERLSLAQRVELKMHSVSCICAHLVYVTYTIDECTHMHEMKCTFNRVRSHTDRPTAILCV